MSEPHAGSTKTRKYRRSSEQVVYKCCQWVTEILKGAWITSTGTCVEAWTWQPVTGNNPKSINVKVGGKLWCINTTWQQKEQITDTCSNMGQSHRHQAVWEKPDTREYTVWCHLYEFKEQAKLIDSDRIVVTWVEECGVVNMDLEIDLGIGS